MIPRPPERDIIIDTHDREVIEPVWALYARALEMLPALPAIMIERDDHIPPLPELLTELDRAREISGRVLEPA